MCLVLELHVLSSLTHSTFGRSVVVQRYCTLLKMPLCQRLISLFKIDTAFLLA